MIMEGGKKTLQFPQAGRTTVIIYRVEAAGRKCFYGMKGRASLVMSSDSAIIADLLTRRSCGLGTKHKIDVRHHLKTWRPGLVSGTGDL